MEPVSPTTALPLPLPTDVQIKSQRHFYRRRSAWGAIKSKTTYFLSGKEFVQIRDLSTGKNITVVEFCKAQRENERGGLIRESKCRRGNICLLVMLKFVLVKISGGISNRWEVAKTVWPYMISICLAYFVTLCLFPGIESEVPSCRLLSWMPVILIGIFNLFDFIGKVRKNFKEKKTLWSLFWPPVLLIKDKI